MPRRGSKDQKFGETKDSFPADFLLSMYSEKWIFLSRSFFEEKNSD
jgi:hypothetical protein